MTKDGNESRQLS